MRAKLLAVGILCCTSTALASGQNPLSALAASAKKDADAQIVLGDLYVEAMLLDDAKHAFKQAKVRNPSQSRLGAAKILMKQQNFRGAKQACRKIAQDYQKSSIGDICSGWFWISNGRISRAIEDFEKAIAKGDVAGGKLGIGDAMRLNSDWQGAIDAYDASIGAFEKSGGTSDASPLIDKRSMYLAYLGKGLVLEQKGDKTGAIQALKLASQAQPASCMARYHYGRLMDSGTESVTALEAAIAMRPDWFEARITLGKAYEKGGSYEEAVKIYKAAIEANPQLGDPYFGLAGSLVKLGHDDEALEALKTLSTLIPNHVEGYLLTAEIYARKKEADMAIEALDRARDVASGDVEVFIRSAQIYMNVGRYTNARAFLNQALTMKPNISRAHAMLGQIACERRRYDEGRNHYDKALKGDLVGVDKKEIAQKQSLCKK